MREFKKWEKKKNWEKSLNKMQHREKDIRNSKKKLKEMQTGVQSIV